MDLFTKKLESIELEILLILFTGIHPYCFCCHSTWIGWLHHPHFQGSSLGDLGLGFGWDMLIMKVDTRQIMGLHHQR